MRFSVWPSLTQPWGAVAELVAHIEATGWDGVYLADHFMGDGTQFGTEATPTLEATAALSALAATTSRLRLANLVLSITYRHPAVLAKWAATVDHLSAGRLLLGVGAGWQVNEHEQYGIALGTPGERLARLDEGLRVLRGLLDTPRTTVAGRFYEVTDAVAEPKPLQDRLPILIGGKGDRMLGLVAEHADAWNMWSTPPLLAERGAVLDRRCEAIGRDPGSLERSTQALVFLVDDDTKAADLVARVAPRAAVAGPPARIGDWAAAWADAGATELIIPDFTLGEGAQRLDALDALLEEFTPLR